MDQFYSFLLFMSLEELLVNITEHKKMFVIMYYNNNHIILHNKRLCAIYCFHTKTKSAKEQVELKARKPEVLC